MVATRIVKVPTISRRPPEKFKAPIRAYAIAIGEAIWAANFAHAAFSRLFAVLVCPNNLIVGLTQWNAISVDNVQRELLLAAARAALRKQPKMLKKIEWAIDKAKSLANTRNDAAHLATAFGFESTLKVKIVPDPLSNKLGRLKRLEAKTKIERDFRFLKGDYYALGMYVNTLWTEIVFPSKWPLRQKPKLKLA